MFTEIHSFAQSFSTFQTNQTRMGFQILYRNEAVPSNLLWHTCCRLPKLKLEGNAATKIVRTRMAVKLVDVWLEGTLRMGIQS